MTSKVLSHEEYSAEEHRKAHEQAAKTKVFARSYGTYCFHCTDGVEEQWKISTLGGGNVWIRDGEVVENPDLDDAQLALLVGHKIVDVDMGESTLKFTTADGNIFTYEVEGDCCSYSYFYDMHGKDKLLSNGPVVSVREIELENPDVSERRDKDGFVEEVKAYGYEIVTQHPKWGEQTTVFSFRNDSNGYYGGMMNFVGVTGSSAV